MIHDIDMRSKLLELICDLLDEASLLGTSSFIETDWDFTKTDKAMVIIKADGETRRFILSVTTDGGES